MRGNEAPGTSSQGHGPVVVGSGDSDKRDGVEKGFCALGGAAFLRPPDGDPSIHRLAKAKAVCWQSANPVYSRLAILISFAFIVVMLIMAAVKEGGVT